MKELTPMDAAKQALINQNKQGEILVNVIDHVEEIADHVDEVAEKGDKQYTEIKKEMSFFRDHMLLSDGEITKIQSIVSSRATITTRAWLKKTFGSANYGGSEFFSKKYGHIISRFWSILKKHYDAQKYTAIKHVDYKDALELVQQLNINDLPAQTMRITDKQLETLNKWEISHGYNLTEPKD